MHQTEHTGSVHLIAYYFHLSFFKCKKNNWLKIIYLKHRISLSTFTVYFSCLSFIQSPVRAKLAAVVTSTSFADRQSQLLVLALVPGSNPKICVFFFPRYLSFLSLSFSPENKSRNNSTYFLPTLTLWQHHNPCELHIDYCNPYIKHVSRLHKYVQYAFSSFVFSISQ